MTLKSYRLKGTVKKKKPKKRKESDLIKKPISSGIKLGLGFVALGIGLSAMDRI